MIKFLAVTSTQLTSISVSTSHRVIYVTDTQDVYIEKDNTRTQIRDVVYLPTEDDKPIAPLNKLYYVVATSKLYYYLSGWVWLNSSGSGSSVTWQVITSNVTAVKNNGYFIDASGGVIDLTLPSSPSLGDSVQIRLVNSTNAITLKRNGVLLEGKAEDMTLDVPNAGFTIVYSDSSNGWLITTEISSPEESFQGYPNVDTDLTSDKHGNVLSANYGQGIDEYTMMYLDMDGRVIDRSASGFVMTATDITYTSDITKMRFNQGAVFNGSTSRITITDVTKFSLGNSDWTFDFYVYRNNGSNEDRIFEQYAIDNTDYSIAFWISSGSKLCFLYCTTPEGVAWDNISGNYTGNITIPAGVLTWISIQRSGTTIKSYVNKVLDKTWNIGTASIRTSSSSIWIGQSPYQNGYFKFNGCIDEFRFSKGIARSINPPIYQYKAVGDNSFDVVPITALMELDYLSAENITAANVIYVASKAGIIQAWGTTTSVTNYLTAQTYVNPDGSGGRKHFMYATPASSGHNIGAWCIVNKGDSYAIGTDIASLSYMKLIPFRGAV